VTSPDARRDAFAAFVRRAVDRAKDGQGWAVPRIAKESGIGTNTIYRWLKGDWVEAPKAAVVDKFCDTLGIPRAAARGILWPGQDQPREPTPALTSEPDFVELLRRLNDPNVPAEEKYLIRETVRGLAARNKPATGAAKKSG
jgi:transcriptional regulator with XRE-family HTH domain